MTTLAARLALVGALAGALASLSACHLFEATEEKTPDDHEVDVNAATYAEQVDAKLRRVSACRDVVASIMSESWERYSDQVDDRGQPRRRREGVFMHGISSNTFRSCHRIVDEAKLPPQMPLIEEQAAAIVETGSAYADLTRTLEPYLDDQTWREDDWARLSELDPQLRSAHEAWLAADRRLLLAIDLRHVENDPVLLGAIESGRGALEVASRRVMIRARPMVRCMVPDDGAGSSASASAPPPSADTCRALFESFDEAVETFTVTYEGDSEGANRVFWMATFANDVDEFHELAKAFLRKLNRRPRSSDVQALLDGYSSLVRDAETLNFEFP